MNNLESALAGIEQMTSKATEGPWRIICDAQGPSMVMHPDKNGMAVASCDDSFYPVNGFCPEKADKNPTPCPEIEGVTYWAERVANVRLIAASRTLIPALVKALMTAVEQRDYWMRHAASYDSNYAEIVASNLEKENARLAAILANGREGR